MENRQQFQKRIQNEYNEVLKNTEDNSSTIKYLRNIGIYDDNILCESDECINFGGPTQTIKDNNSSDGYRQYCSSCKNTQSIRKNSAFSKVRTSASTIIRVMIKETFSNKSQHQIAKEYGISSYTRSSISYYEKQHRESTILGLQTFEDEDERQLPYASAAIEVDECMITHMTGDQCWILGMYDRALNDCVMISVGNNRSSQVINNIFQQYVSTDEIQRTRVYCDMWRGYNGLQNLGYEVFRVNHSIEFGEGHRTTNHIEAYWRVLQKFCRFNSGLVVDNIEDAQKEVDFAWAQIRCNKNNQSQQQLIIESVVQYSNEGFTLNNFRDFQGFQDEEEEIDAEVGGEMGAEEEEDEKGEEIEHDDRLMEIE